ncbi:hypothetical protein D3C77_660600 [compost metagenome]
MFTFPGVVQFANDQLIVNQFRLGIKAWKVFSAATAIAAAANVNVNAKVRMRSVFCFGLSSRV